VGEIGRDFYLARLRAAECHRRTVVHHDSDAYRVVHGEADLLPALVVDRYGDYLAMQTLDQGMDAAKSEIASCLTEIFEPRGIVARNDVAVRTKEQLPLETAVMAGEVPGAVAVRINGLTMHADLLHGQKTGIFLDQRENYRAAAHYARGGKALDCFTSTGGFALQLAAKCQSVEAVDSSSNLSAATTYNWTVNAAAIAAPGDFALSVRGSGQTLAAGGEAQYTVTVSTTPAGDVCNNPVTLSVKGLPPGATAGFSPAAVTPGAGSATSTLTVQMAATSAKLRPDGGGWALALPMLAVILLAPTRRGQKRKSHNAFMILFCLLILGAVCATVGCGGGFAVTPSSSSYTLTITGTNGSVNHSTTVTLAVK